jgi:hypothetical protein
MIFANLRNYFTILTILGSTLTLLKANCLLYQIFETLNWEGSEEY